MKTKYKKITKLDKTKMKIIHYEFEIPMEAIGKMYGISRQRVHQIIKGKK